ncbi:YraN family protein [Bacteroidota bacterium]
MADHIEIGREGEELAVQYLIDKKWEILERNWRSGHREIDIIAKSGEELIIVEVKVRKFIGGERLEEHITGVKQKYLIRAASSYLAWKKLDLGVRFDIILLTGERGRYRIEHIENAFSPWD